MSLEGRENGRQVQSPTCEVGGKTPRGISKVAICVGLAAMAITSTCRPGERSPTLDTTEVAAQALEGGDIQSVSVLDITDSAPAFLNAITSGDMFKANIGADGTLFGSTPDEGYMRSAPGAGLDAVPDIPVDLTLPDGTPIGARALTSDESGRIYIENGYFYIPYLNHHIPIISGGNSSSLITTRIDGYEIAAVSNFRTSIIGYTPDACDDIRAEYDAGPDMMAHTPEIIVDFEGTTVQEILGLQVLGDGTAFIVIGLTARGPQAFIFEKQGDSFVDVTDGVSDEIYIQMQEAAGYWVVGESRFMDGENSFINRGNKAIIYNRNTDEIFVIEVNIGGEPADPDTDMDVGVDTSDAGMDVEVDTDVSDADTEIDTSQDADTSTDADAGIDTTDISEDTDASDVSDAGIDVEVDTSDTDMDVEVDTSDAGIDVEVDTPDTGIDVEVDTPDASSEIINRSYLEGFVYYNVEVDPEEDDIQITSVLPQGEEIAFVPDAYVRLQAFIVGSEGEVFLSTVLEAVTGDDGFWASDDPSNIVFTTSSIPLAGIEGNVTITVVDLNNMGEGCQIDDQGVPVDTSGCTFFTYTITVTDQGIVVPNEKDGIFQLREPNDGGTSMAVRLPSPHFGQGDPDSDVDNPDEGVEVLDVGPDVDVDTENPGGSSNQGCCTVSGKPPTSGNLPPLLTAAATWFRRRKRRK